MFTLRAALHGLLGWFGVIMLSAISVPALGERLNFTTGNWSPCVIVHNGRLDREKPGFCAEIVREAFANVGYELEYTILPYARQISAVMGGGHHAILGVYRDEAPDLKYPVEIIGISQNCFFTTRDFDWSYSGVASARDIRLTLVGNYLYGDAAFEAMVAEGGGNLIALTGQEENNLLRMTRLLDAGRADVFVEDRDIANYFFQLQGRTGDFVEAGCLREVAIRIGFSPATKQTPELIRIFDQEVAKLRRSGKMREILDRYGVRDWK